MIQQMSRFILALAFTCSTALCFAQQNTNGPKAPRWTSNQGFWVVEDNINVPNKSTVYFYNQDKELVYKEQIDGIKLRLDKRKVLMRFKSVLETSVLAWEAQNPAKENETLLATALGKKKTP